MASTQHVKPASESQLSGSTPSVNFFPFTRFMVFASTLTAVIVMVTSKQTELVPVLSPFGPAGGFILQDRPAKFNYSPAFIYFVVALSVACLYSILSTFLSLSARKKPHTWNKLLFHFIVTDVLTLGIVASATGTAGGVAYIGLKGNSHVGWPKICTVYDKFCRYVGTAVALSLFASVLLVALVILSAYFLYRRSR